MKLRERPLALAVWLAVLVACVVVILQTRFVSDLSAFMPRAPNARQQMLVEQLRDGIIARLLMVGIEGGDAAERARLSHELAAVLRKDSAFVGVQNGEEATQERDRVYFFDNRYLLSPAVSADRFSADGLKTAIGASIEALSGNAGLMLKSLLPRDPTGETLQLLEQFAGGSQPSSLEGAWASKDGKRALLLLQIRAEGSDTDAQAQAIATIKSKFASISARQADTRVVMSGTGVFSVASRDLIESEVSRLAAASAVLVVCLLLAVYRSVLLLALGLLPVVSGALVGIATVSLGFGHVHGLTLGFGTTLIGEAVDYSIYLFIQRSGGADPRRFWRTIRIGVLTSIVGFAALLCSGFPGLAQLGAYSISGLVAAALVTRFVLPGLVPPKLNLRDLSGTGIALESVIHRASRLRWAILALLLTSGAVITMHSGKIWNRQLSALSPISKADQQLDQELRGDMGAPDMRYIAAFTAANAEEALQGAEKTGTVLQGLARDGVIGGFNSPALVLPSAAMQRARQASLPDTESLRANLKQALVDLPVKPERLEGFVEDIAKARSQKLLGRDDLAGSSSALLVDSLLVKRAKDYLVLMPLRAIGTGPKDELIDLDKVAAALKTAGLAQVTVIDILEETTHLFESYLGEALWLCCLGSLAILALLGVALRSLPRTLRIAAPLACSVLCVTAALLLAGIQLTILHLVGLLLVVAVGSNYALFFDSGSQDGAATERRQTLVSLVVANLTTVGSFGVLGLSKVPILAAIGTTVGPGAFLALLFSAVFAQVKSDGHSK